MEMRVLIGFFLVFTAAGLPVEEETSSNGGDIFTDVDFALFENEELYVYDDDENLVKITINENEAQVIEKQIWGDVESRVFFFLHTTKNPTMAQPLYVNNEDALRNSNFDPTKPTRFVTHGWMNSRNSAACTLIRDAYIQHGDYNVIVIDWSKITFRPYVWASNHVKKVGHFVSTMINFLAKHGMDLSKTTMVGHSLGAHVVGIAARETEGNVNYVVGLDPALPGFALAGPGSRISSGDASHVEIIHTNAGLLGYLAAIGDSDFYPNGGSKQLGCLVDVGGACSHARSFRFFAESINSPVGFHGKRCSSFVRYKMGLCKRGHTSIMGGLKRFFEASGSYYLMTKSKFPFAVGKFF